MSDNNPQQDNVELPPNVTAALKQELIPKRGRGPLSAEAKAARAKNREKKKRRERRAARWAPVKAWVTSRPLIVCVVVVGALFGMRGIDDALSIPGETIVKDQSQLPIEPRDDPGIVPTPVQTESIPRLKMFDEAFDALPPEAGDIPAVEKQKGKSKKGNKQSDSQIMQLASLVIVDREAPREPQFELPPVPRSDGEDDPMLALASAREYLVETSTPGGTMARQGPQLAIERLHPEFVLRLAPAIKEARIRGLPCAGVFSAYRPPAFGVGGFADKSASLHAYGLAVDMKCVGRPGSRDAKHWHSIARRHGVICPYGPNNRAEWNHCQPTNLKVVQRGNPLRKTITPQGPIDLERMWNAARSLIARVETAAANHEPQSVTPRARRVRVQPAEDRPLFQSAS